MKENGEEHDYSNEKKQVPHFVILIEGLTEIIQHDRTRSETFIHRIT